jgi:amino acid transporter
LLAVAAVLFLFRSIYAEVVGALPLNGGAYNALLNTTSKFRASLAACLTILSYMATAVISASEAMHYVHGLWDGLPVIWATVGLLAVFMFLTILGITESAAVAVVIFFVHLSTLGLLLLIGGGYVLSHGTEALTLNLETSPESGLLTALFFGFCAAMLGISGFESSANFVEEQAEGVFPKTLRNMWIAVSILNPGMALLALALVPIADVETHQEALLAHMGDIAGGRWLATLISVDAALVLSGAVLTSYVGVNGLVTRMTLDRCLPQFLLKANRWGNTHRIQIAFFLLTVSILFITQGDLKALAGVYTISFLAVMALFGLGNVLLKVRRAQLPRPSQAGWPSVLIGIGAVTAGLIGNAVMNPRYLGVFLEYFLPALLIVSIMLGRITLLKAGMFILRAAIMALIQPMSEGAHAIRNWIDRINAQQMVFFTREDDIATLRTVMDYIRTNEHTNRVKIVTVVPEGEKPPPSLKKDLNFLDKAYPEIDVEFVVLEGEFTPELITQLSEEWQIPTNLMFIGSPRGHLMYGLAELHGVRLII